MITISQAGFDAHPLIPSDSLSALSHGDLDACGSRRVTHSCCSCVCVCLCICRAVCITAVYTPRISVFACSDKWVSAHLFPLRMQIMSLVWWRFPSEAADKLKAPDTTLHFFCLYLLNVYRFLKNVIPNLSVQVADNHRERKKKKNRKFNTILTTLPHVHAKTMQLQPIHDVNQWPFHWRPACRWILKYLYLYKGCKIEDHHNCHGSLIIALSTSCIINEKKFNPMILRVY